MSRIDRNNVAAFLTATAVAWSVLAAVPDFSVDRMNRMQSALENLSACRYEQAETIAASLTSGDPTGRAWAIVAAAREARGQYGPALRACNMWLATTDTPQYRPYIADQIARCKNAIAPVPVAPSRTLTPEQLRDLARVEDVLSAESSEHFVVRARNGALAKMVIREAEAALGRICTLQMGSAEYPHSIEIDVYSTHDEYLDNVPEAPEWSGGTFLLDESAGQVQRKIALTQLTPEGQFRVATLDRILPHEMCHLITKEYFGDAPCPLFLREGMAMLCEEDPDNGRIALAGAALATDEAIELSQLLTLQAQDMDNPELFYAESFSLLSYLQARMTARQFSCFLGHVKEGCAFDDALQRALFVAPADAFLPAFAAAWADDAIVQTQYLRALKNDYSMP